MGKMKEYVMELEERRNNEEIMCDTCFDTREVSTIEVLKDEDHGMIFEEGKKKVPCPECCKDFYKDAHLGDDNTPEYE
jgi:hypothetical protein